MARLVWVAPVGLMLAALAPGAGAAIAQPMPQQGQDQVEVLHQALRLAPDQESAWAVYRSVANVPEQAQERRRAASGLFRTLDAPHRMDLVQAEMEAELADLRRQSQALKTFYAALTPEQRVIFDQRTLPPMGGQQGPQMGPPNG
jgi:hypothetical protein